MILSKDIDKYAFMCGSNFYESDVIIQLKIETLQGSSARLSLSATLVVYIIALLPSTFYPLIVILHWQCFLKVSKSQKPFMVT